MHRRDFRCDETQSRPGAWRRPWLAMAMFVALFVSESPAFACDTPVSICDKGNSRSFALIAGGRPASLHIDASADSAIRHVADNFAADLERVGGRAPQRIARLADARGPLVLIGVLGKSAAIDGLVSAGKIDAADITGHWEAYRQIVVDKPYPGVPRALVIVGADRRGAVFGTYDISQKIGVSPWHWWADIPVQRRRNVHLTAGSLRDQPKVKYRGFFINDEEPGFGTWARAKFGGINARMYAHVFELLLRMKGNYLWPAMWAPKAFNDDDPQNMVLADAMGVVMGTSHHEPLTRAQDEWHRNKEKGVTGGKWDYATNAENLRTFWRGGIERMMSKGDGQGYEALVTVGMRGDGDEAMAEGTAIELLERIVTDQRRIIADVTGKPADRTPQMWALYKEVQDYYDHGMKVPDDVTLLFADDNWGQIRRLPAPNSERTGGYGVYYHFDYVGAPRNYKWLNTNQIEKVWQQMDLAYASGARTIWIVNVGDIKPMEYPLSFFMDQAWDPEAMTLDAMSAYPEQWARRTFGPEQAEEIAWIVTRYSQLGARRKPELIDAESFALGSASAETLDGGEFGAMIAEWLALEERVNGVKARLPPDQGDAFFQLVEHPVVSLSNLYQLYFNVAWNRRLAAAGDPRANVFADRAEAAFVKDQQISDAYHALAGGKWQGMMLQTHIGYTSWQQPDRNIMPEVKRVTASGETPRPRLAWGSPAAPVAGDVFAIEAPHFARGVGGKGLEWRVIPHLGRTLGAVTAFPQGRPATTIEDGVRLEYDVSLSRPGDLAVQLYLVPTLDTSGRNSLRIGVSVDDGPVTILTDRQIPAPTTTTMDEQRNWNKAVMDNARMLQVSFPGVAAGAHVVKLWRLDDNVVVQKLVMGTGAIPASYLGPPETPGYAKAR